MPDAPKTDKPATPPAESTPPWGDDFDAERAWRLVQNLRSEVSGLKTERDAARSEATEFRSAAEKTGEERDRALADAVTRAENAERKLAISSHNLPDDVVEEFGDYLTGSPQEVATKAAKLAARLGLTKIEEPAPNADEPPAEPAAPQLPGRPKTAPVPGSAGDPNTEPAFDPVAIAAAARARR